MKNMYQVVKNYKDNETLRKSFNELAKTTFGIDFEDWYQNGYWTEKYNPYSIVDEGKIVANVSVNITDFIVEGEVKHYLQLGTVMTDKAYRGQGLIRILMEEVEKDHAGKAEGWYLFANRKVLNFYPKFGFTPKKEYEYYRKVAEGGNTLFSKVSMKCKEEWDVLEEKIKNSFPQAALELVNNSQLPMFYVSKFMQENVYYSEKLDVYVVMEIEDGRAVISAVISEKEQDMVLISESLGAGIHHVVLGFTPRGMAGFEKREVQDVDTTLFVKGDFAKVLEGQMMFPVLAHA